VGNPSKILRAHDKQPKRRMILEIGGRHHHPSDDIIPDPVILGVDPDVHLREKQSR